ncbi:hypothetical protein B0H11DRAFT_2234401 [Mycena galericulata]|nr:hypothetical protein B0H11DRAFT_2234401 [Mycena galericulata]
MARRTTDGAACGPAGEFMYISAALPWPPPPETPEFIARYKGRESYRRLRPGVHPGRTPMRGPSWRDAAEQFVRAPKRSMSRRQAATDAHFSCSVHRYLLRIVTAPDFLRLPAASLIRGTLHSRRIIRERRISKHPPYLERRL